MSPSKASAISLWGKYYEVDSLTACVRAAMASWGTELPYYHVAGLSGAAFSPSLRPDAACVACPVRRSDPGRVEFLGHALGFSVTISRASRDDGFPELSRRARRAAADGAVILCGSWPCWSIVREWDDDPTQLALASPVGVELSCTVDATSPLCVLRPTQPCLTSREAFKEAVRFGAAVASGQHPAPREDSGVQFYDAWLAQVQAPTFCPHGHPEGWRCAERAASGAVATCLSAVRFLNRIHSVPMHLSDREDLDAAARAFARIAAKLSPFTTGSGLGQIWQKPHTRACYVRALGCARETHARAAGHLSRMAAVL